MGSNETQWRELARLFGQLTPVMYPSPSPVAKITPTLPVSLEVLWSEAAGTDSRPRMCRTAALEQCCAEGCKDRHSGEKPGEAMLLPQNSPQMQFGASLMGSVALASDASPRLRVEDDLPLPKVS